MTRWIIGGEKSVAGGTRLWNSTLARTGDGVGQGHNLQDDVILLALLPTIPLWHSITPSTLPVWCTSLPPYSLRCALALLTQPSKSHVCPSSHLASILDTCIPQTALTRPLWSLPTRSRGRLGPFKQTLPARFHPHPTSLFP